MSTTGEEPGTGPDGPPERDPTPAHGDDSSAAYDPEDPAMLRSTWDPAAAGGVPDPLASLYADPAAAAARREHRRRLAVPETPPAEPPASRWPGPDGVVLSVPQWLLLLVYVPLLALLTYGVVGAAADREWSVETVGGLLFVVLLPGLLLVLTLQTLRHRVVADGRWLHVRGAFGWRTPVDLERLDDADVVQIGRNRFVVFRDRERREVRIDRLHGDLELLYRHLAERWDGDQPFLRRELARRLDRFREDAPATARRRGLRRSARRR